MHFLIAFLGLSAFGFGLRRVLRARSLEALRRAYADDAAVNGREKARARCAHPFKTFAQTGLPGMTTVTRRVCAVCGLDLGAATLRDGLFGSYWS